jgi:hypothetical protein
MLCINHDAETVLGKGTTKSILFLNYIIVILGYLVTFIKVLTVDHS